MILGNLSIYKFLFQQKYVILLRRLYYMIDKQENSKIIKIQPALELPSGPCTSIIIF